MFLEARAASCFSSTYVLKLDDRAIGKYEGRWFSESLDLALTGRRRLEFRNVGWLSSHFELVATGDELMLASCCHSGIFTASWDLLLSTGPGQLVKEGWFGSGYEVQQGDAAMARVDRLGMCERGWLVDGGGELALEDMLLIGLVYHTILQRQAKQQQHGGHAAGS